MAKHPQDAVVEDYDDEEPGVDLLAMLQPALARWRLLLGVMVACGAVGGAASYLVTPTFTAANTFLPPQQQQGGAAGALAALGGLSSLIGSGGTHNSPEQYIAFMQSVTVSDRIIRKFGLKKLWDEAYDVDARTKLSRKVQISINKKDSFIKVEVTDADPVRAANMANQYVEELRTVTNTLAVTEAQQRRVFFQQLLEQTRDRLAAAQTALEASGYTAGALNSEPRSAAEGYARLRAELTSAQVRLQVLRNSLADTAPEVRSAQETVNALTSQLARLEGEGKGQPHTGDYVNRYREFKYQETLFDLFARQYESARVDESREGALVQVVDPATPPEKKSGPKRSMYAGIAGLLGMAIAALVLVVRARRPARPAAGAAFEPA